MNNGRKDDGGKSRMDLLPFGALLEMGKVLEFGARKYSPDNWRKVDDLENRYLAAALRHLAAYKLGEEIDPESKVSHLAHVMTNLGFVLEYKLTQKTGE